MKLLLYFSTSALRKGGARESRDNVLGLPIDLNKGVMGWGNTDIYFAGRWGRRSNLLNKCLCRTLETNKHVVEARIILSGDGDLSTDLIPGSVSRDTLVSLVV